MYADGLGCRGRREDIGLGERYSFCSYIFVVSLVSNKNVLLLSSWKENLIHL